MTMAAHPQVKQSGFQLLQQVLKLLMGLESQLSVELKSQQVFANAPSSERHDAFLQLLEVVGSAQLNAFVVPAKLGCGDGFHGGGLSAFDVHQQHLPPLIVGLAWKAVRFRGAWVPAFGWNFLEGVPIAKGEVVVGVVIPTVRSELIGPCFC